MKKIFSKVVAILLLIITTLGVVPQKVLATENKDKIKDFINKNNKNGTSIILIENGDIVNEFNVGYADKENNIKVDSSTVFEWGSTSKLLVWVSIMQLVEDGKISLEDDISKLLPTDFFSKLKYDKPITILNLMNHNAGWADNNKDLLIWDSKKILPLSDALKKYEPKQIYEPGKIVAYSNYGTAIAGYIVELVSGMPYYEYVNKNIFNRLNMKNTSIEPTQLDNSYVKENREKIKGYGLDGKEIATSRTFISLYPAGACIGTIGDMAKFVQALMLKDEETSPLFSNKKTLDLMLMSSLDYSDNKVRVSHGFFSYEIGNETILGHGGNTIGFSSQILFSKKLNKVIIIMTNIDSEWELIEGLPKLFFNENIQKTSYTDELPKISGIDGFYFNSRRYIDTYLSTLSWISPYIVKQISDNEISLSGIVCTQVEPYVFEGDDFKFRVNVSDGQVTGLTFSNTYDIVKKSTGEVAVTYLFIILTLIGVLYSIISLIVKLIGYIISKVTKREEKSKLKKLSLLSQLGYLAIIINILIMSFTSMSVMYNKLTPYFIINISIIPLTFIYIYRMLKYYKYYQKGFLDSLITGVFLISLSITIILLNLWR